MGKLFDSGCQALSKQLRVAVSSKMRVKTTEQISPALKSWLDNVIVPALVREYLSKTEKRIEFASQSKFRLECRVPADPDMETTS